MKQLSYHLGLTWSEAIVLLMALGVLCLSALEAMNGQITGWEQQLNLWVYHWPSGWRPAMLVLTLGGSVWALAATTAVLTWFRLRKQAVLTLAVGLMTAGACELLKQAIGRPRPGLLIPDIMPRAASSGNGFPSGHSAMIVFLSFMLWPLIPRSFRWLLPLVAGSVFISRIYLGVHSPLDIVGGATIGCLTGLVCNKTWSPKKSRLAAGRA
jgi:membrane-associated phospholipid phosphatase